MATTETRNTLQNKHIYLVFLEGEPVAFHKATSHDSQIKSHQIFNPERAYGKSLIESHDHLLKSTLDTGSYTKLYSFHHIINGFAIHTTQSQADKLRRVQGVSLIEKDRGVKLMTTYTPNFLGLPKGAWAQEGGEEHAGEGIVIGVIDTGINPKHPSFAYDPSKPYDNPRFCGVCDVGPKFPQGSCNGKIVSARFFSAGAASVLPLNASKDLTPFDQVGHGSHVASIAAGNWGVPVVVNGVVYGFASGMAPQAKIAVYKAIYPEGGTMADVVYAIEQATKDGVDVMVLSIGPDEAAAEEEEETITMMSVFEILLLFVRRAGVFVVQAAGNKGPCTSTVVSFSPWAFAAAAATTGRSYISTLVLGNGSHLFGMGLSGPTQGKGKKKLKLVDAKDASKVVMVTKNNETTSYSNINAEECQDPETLDPMVVKNSIVICTFSQGFFNGTSTITAIINTSILLSFAGFIFAANPDYGDFIAQPLPFSLPAIIIPSIADVETLMEYYNNHTERDKSTDKVIKFKARASIKEGRVASFNESSPTVSSFSSRGPDILDNKLNPADVLKPDILAPGHQIWAAWSPSSGHDPIFSDENFAMLSGTSMAAPHVAGVAALLMKAHPTWSPSMVASAICTSSLQCNNKGLPIMAHGLEVQALYPSTPFDHGAGFINPTAALDPGLVFSSAFEDYINFLCSLPNLDPSKVRSVTGKACNTSHQTSTSDLNLPSITLSKLSKFKSVKRQVLNVAKYPEKYLCSIVAPHGTLVDVMPRWFTIFPQEIQVLEIQINVTNPLKLFTFGEIVLVGSLNHVVRFPLSVFPMEV
ncbi:LOW QUALITY PROTEIN: subtilisin-like protease SBT2.4 [Dioscorea cayenensis subsp. rotundata]|uniref:LOW QUALITY PROTEIN: subtilisin-like protease SBT2.4 n=1 Tax=Dioscorea cayennensis subsp. rotundata TaxID=55577 RepID=A0AB40CTV1_DIOCR|nr:LOW QUALITY PROTEIN: subtilisin-like protease SBT2.4 [Dioscorea cayenensis subsp. rotundata]